MGEVPLYCFGTNLAHIRQLQPDSGLVHEVHVLKTTCKLTPLRLEVAHGAQLDHFLVKSGNNFAHFH